MAYQDPHVVVCELSVLLYSLPREKASQQFGYKKLKKLNIKTLKRLSSIHGDSFYLLDSGDFVASYNSILKEFRNFYPKTKIAYSYKTNYIPRLCKIVDDLGGYAETVSGMEVDVALAIGVPARNIFFNGPYKPRVEIEKLLLMGGVVNVDSEADLTEVCNIASEIGDAVLRIGVRCNFSIGDGVTSRFGFDVNNGDFESAVYKLKEYQNIDLIGLHCHFASRHIEAWENATVGMLEVISRFQNISGTSPRYVSLGGGLYGEMSDQLRAELNISPPTFRDYATAAAQPFAQFYKKHKASSAPELLIEPGTALAANALSFVSRVINIKTVNNKSIATLAGSSFNTTPGAKSINLPIKIYHAEKPGSAKEYISLDMGGYTCIETDYLYQNYSGPLSIGDFVVFEAAGSYSVVMKPPFIMPNVPILEINDDSSVAVLKRQESFADLFQTFQFKF